MDAIDNGEDFINATDVDARIADLETTQKGLRRHGNDLEDWDAEELAALRELRDDARGLAGSGLLSWPGSVTLIRDSHFGDYARDLADDTGDCRDEGSVSAYVDWQAYADALKQDYASVDFGGVTYWARG